MGSHGTWINKNRVVPAVVGAVLFALLAFFVMTRETLVFDTVVREALYGIRGDGLTVFFKAITLLGNEQTITLFCILLLLIPGLRRSFGVPLTVAALFGAGIQHVLKITFQRVRPDLSLHLIEQGGYSFPSGHSFTGLLFYGLALFLCRRAIKNRTAANLATVLLSCLIFFIGLSRIYLGVHYPTDVLGGWSLGLCVLMLLITVLLRFREGRNRL